MSRNFGSYSHIVPYGANSGSFATCVWKRCPAPLSRSDLKEFLASIKGEGSSFTQRFPVLLDDESLRLLTPDEVAAIRRQQPVWGYHSPDTRFWDYGFDFRSVIVRGETDPSRILKCTEIVTTETDMWSLCVLCRDTDADHYYVLIEDDEAEREVKEVLGTVVGRTWRITQPCFCGVSINEMEEMYNASEA